MRVDVWSDFVCPWCFLASISLEKLRQSHNVEIVWRSYELRPKGSPPMPEEYRQYIETKGRPQMEATARQHYGIEMNQGEFDVESRAALIGDKYAEVQGKGAAYHDAVFRAYWQEARRIDDVKVLREIAESVGLDGDAFEAALQDPVYEQAVLDDIMQARDYGLSGVPAMVFDGKYLVSGAQPYDVLVQVVEKIQAGM